MPEVIMPKMGDAMEEGTLLKWLKSEGEEVSEGDPIAEIETDKVTLELEAEDAGTLAQLIASEGQDVPVGEAIAFIAGEGEEVPERDGSSSVGAEQEKEEGGEAQAQTATETEEEEVTSEEQPVAQADAQADGRADGQFRASPIVRRLAQENDLDLSKIDGSGPAGRIVERDVKAAMERGDAMADGGGADGQADVAAPEQPSEGQAQMQGFQPARLPEPTDAPGHAARRADAHDEGHRRADDRGQAARPALLRHRRGGHEQRDGLEEAAQRPARDEGIKLSVNDFVMKACATALRNHPNLNAIYTTRGVELHQKVDMAMAVASIRGSSRPSSGTPAARASLPSRASPRTSRPGPERVA
jgi:pyruvate dehydrogenase E2 component (dihydrolipoamide acetyltransferase)